MASNPHLTVVLVDVQCSPKQQYIGEFSFAGLEDCGQSAGKHSRLPHNSPIRGHGPFSFCRMIRVARDSAPHARRPNTLLLAEQRTTCDLTYIGRVTLNSELHATLRTLVESR
eukprot:9402013-Pyramimonas_sp.AAC.1